MYTIYSIYYETLVNMGDSSYQLGAAFLPSTCPSTCRSLNFVMGILVLKHCEGSRLSSWCISRFGHCVFHGVVPRNNELRVQHDEAWEDQDLLRPAGPKGSCNPRPTFLLRISLLKPPHPGQFARFTNAILSLFVKIPQSAINWGWGHVIISDWIPQQKPWVFKFIWIPLMNKILNCHSGTEPSYGKRIFLITSEKSQHVCLKPLFPLKDKNSTQDPLDKRHFGPWNAGLRGVERWPWFLRHPQVSMAFFPKIACGVDPERSDPHWGFPPMLQEPTCYALNTH